MKITVGRLRESIRSALAESESSIPPEFDDVFRNQAQQHNLLDFTDPDDDSYNPFSDPEFKANSFWIVPTADFHHDVLMKGPVFVVQDPSYDEFLANDVRSVWTNLDGYINFTSYLSQRGMI